MSKHPQTTSCWKLVSSNGASSLKLEQDTPLQALTPHDVLVKIHAISLNSRDIQIANGTYIWGATHPVTPCTDCSGTILAVGADVTRFALGDRVISTFHPKWLAGRSHPLSTAQFSQIGAHEQGVLAQHAVFDQQSLVALPEYLSFEEAATLPCAAVTAWSSLFGSSRTVKPGDVVLVQGSGGVSLFAIQFARAAGARVIATSARPDSERGQRLKALGVSDVVSYLEAGWGKRTKELTGGRGVDFIVETSGAGSENAAAIALGGQIAVVGGDGASGKNVIDMRATFGEVRRIGVGSRELFEEMLRAMDVCKIKPILDKRAFDFDAADSAFDYAARGSPWGKVVIKVDSKAD